MVDHDVVRLDVPVHDAHAVAVIESLQMLIQVVPDVIVRQGLIQLLEVRVVNMLKDKRRSSAHRVLDHSL